MSKEALEETRDLSPSSPFVGEEGTRKIIEMRLCEAARVVLQPNQLYRFTVAPGCPLCEAEAGLLPGTPHDMLPTTPAPVSSPQHADNLNTRLQAAKKFWGLADQASSSNPMSPHAENIKSAFVQADEERWS